MLIYHPSYWNSRAFWCVFVDTWQNLYKMIIDYFLNVVSFKAPNCSLWEHFIQNFPVQSWSSLEYVWPFLKINISKLNFKFWSALAYVTFPLLTTYLHAPIWFLIVNEEILIPFIFSLIKQNFILLMLFRVH